MELAKNKFAIRRHNGLVRFANWLQQLPNKDTGFGIEKILDIRTFAKYIVVRKL
jgi:hypothetical protein